MKRKFLYLLGALSFISTTYGEGEVGIGTQNVSVIDFNGNLISSALESQFWSSISNVVSSITGGTSVPIINQKLSDLLLQFIHGIVCPEFSLPSLNVGVKIPTSISIALPCQNFSVNFSKVTAQALSNSNIVKIGRSVDEKIANCIRHPQNCDDKEIKKLLNSQSILASMKLEGLSGDKKYTQKSAEEVQHEIEDTTKTMSVADVQYLTDHPEGVSVNQASQNIRISKLNDAGSSFGELNSIGKENFSSKSSNVVLEPYYNFVASKQIARREYIYALEEMLRRERKKLGQIIAIVKGVCNTRWKVPVIQRQYFGNIGDPYKNLAKIEDSFKKIKKELNGKFTELRQTIRNIVDTVQGGQEVCGFRNFCSSSYRNKKNVEDYLDFQAINLTSRFLGGGGNVCEELCPCCPCNSISAYIETAKAEIMTRITEAEHLLATVISKEAYAVRSQIDADIRASTEMLKKVECAKAYLEYQRNYLLTLQLELQIAQLKAIYSQMNKEELEKYNEIKNIVNEQIQNTK